MQVVRYSRVESQSVATTSMDQTGQRFDSVSVTSWSMSIITEESSEGEEILSPEVPVSLLTNVYDVPVVEETLQKTGETSSEDSSADYDTAPLLDAATESVGPNLDAATESVGGFRPFLPLFHSSPVPEPAVFSRSATPIPGAWKSSAARELQAHLARDLAGEEGDLGISGLWPDNPSAYKVEPFVSRILLCFLFFEFDNFN